MVANESPRAVAAELALYEPILHRPEYQGSTRQQLGELLEESFFEITSTGLLCTRDEVLDTMVRFHLTAHVADGIDNLEAIHVEGDTWMVRYVLLQPGRTTLRATLWRRRGSRWVAAFHQGTLAAERPA